MRKKFIAMLLLCNIALAGCSSNSSDSNDRTETQMEPQENAEIQFDQRSSVSEDPENILVAYFSWADNAVLDDDVDAISSPSVIPPGNVQQLAARVKAGPTHREATVPRADTGSKIKQEKGTVPHGGPAPAHCVRQSRSLQGFPPLLKEMALRCRIWNNRFLDRCFNSPKAQKFQRMTRCFGRFL